MSSSERGQSRKCDDLEINLFTGNCAHLTNVSKQIVQTYQITASKREMLGQCWFNVGAKRRRRSGTYAEKL